MRFGMTELLVIFGIALLLFGNRLPQIGRSLGEGIRGLKKGLNEDSEADDEKAKELQSSHSSGAATKESSKSRVDDV